MLRWFVIWKQWLSDLLLKRRRRVRLCVDDQPFQSATSELSDSERKLTLDLGLCSSVHREIYFLLFEDEQVLLRWTRGERCSSSPLQPHSSAVHLPLPPQSLFPLLSPPRCAASLDLSLLHLSASGEPSCPVVEQRGQQSSGRATANFWKGWHPPRLSWREVRRSRMRCRAHVGVPETHGRAEACGHITVFIITSLPVGESWLTGACVFWQVGMNVFPYVWNTGRRSSQFITRFSRFLATKLQVKNHLYPNPFQEIFIFNSQLCVFIIITKLSACTYSVSTRYSWGT